MSRRYRFGSIGSKNTCSIRSLKNAYIGCGVRMTSDKNTVPFDNVPMKGMKIEAYSEQGFRISHSSLPKQVWVDFDQLPLTRLVITNGVISDEITFVENIVSHKMQLIRTLDTEYIDMLYKEKMLDNKKEEIIPISQAIPGQIYVGAQCEEGTEMIYLGSFNVKEYRYTYSYRSYGRSENDTKYFLSKLTPIRAFFAVPNDEISKKEEKELEEKYYGENSDQKRWKLPYEEREQIDKKINDERKQLLKNSSKPRYKVLEFAITSKRIKDVILTNKENPLFKDKSFNLKAILANIHSKTSTLPEVESDFIFTNKYGYGNIFFVQDGKENIEENAKMFGLDYKNLRFEPKTWEDKHK